MCNFMSFIVTKSGNVFYSKHNSSHESIIIENNLDDIKHPEFKTFCRVEIIPPNKLYDPSLKNWIFKIDESEKPDWFTDKHEKKVWLIFRKVVFDFLKIDTEFNITNAYCISLRSKIRAFHNSTVETYDNSTVEAYDNSTIKAHGSSTVEAHCNSTVRAYDNSTIKAHGNSTVKAFGNSIIIEENRYYGKIELNENAQHIKSEK